MREIKTTINSEGLSLEASLELPTNPGPYPGLVLCHPHPLYGGDMDNNVIVSVCRALVREGIACLRFNFRGVGRSEGGFADGIGEQNDARAAVSFLRDREEVDSNRVGILGYSFGGRVALSAGSRIDEVKALAAISPVVPANVPADCLKPKFIVYGTDDNMIPASDILQEAKKMPDPKIIEAVPGVEHFWLGYENSLSRMMVGFFSSTIK